MNRKEAVKQQPRTPAPNPQGVGRPVQQFASKITPYDVELIEKWIKAKTDIIYCINTLATTRGITKPTAYRWYEKVASMVGKRKTAVDNT